MRNSGGAARGQLSICNATCQQNTARMPLQQAPKGPDVTWFLISQLWRRAPSRRPTHPPFSTLWSSCLAAPCRLIITPTAQRWNRIRIASFPSQFIVRRRIRRAGAFPRSIAPDALKSHRLAGRKSADAALELDVGSGGTNFGALGERGKLN